MKKNKIKLISNAFDEKFRRHFSFDPFAIFYFFNAFTSECSLDYSNLEELLQLAKEKLQQTKPEYTYQTFP